MSRNHSNAADHSSYLQGPAGSHRHLTSLCQPGETISKKGGPYSITERRVPELIPVLGSQPAGEATTWLPSHPFYSAGLRLFETFNIVFIVACIL